MLLLATVFSANTYAETTTLDLTSLAETFAIDKTVYVTAANGTKVYKATNAECGDFLYFSRCNGNSTGRGFWWRGTPYLGIGTNSDESNNGNNTMSIVGLNEGAEITFTVYSTGSLKLLSDNVKDHAVDDIIVKGTNKNGTTDVTVTMSKDGNLDLYNSYAYLQKVIIKQGSPKYTVNAVDASGNILKTIATGLIEEGESVTVPYTRYLLTDNGELLKADATNKEYRVTLTGTTTSQTKNIKYSASLSDVVYYSEGEDIEGAAQDTRSNIPTRSSNAKAGYFENDVNLITLAPGKYKYLMGIYSEMKSGSFTLQAGENQYAVSIDEKSNLVEKTSNEFELTQSTPIILLAGGRDKLAIDYLYIQKTGDVESTTASISAAQYATYYDSKSSITVPSGMTAFTISSVENGVITKGTEYKENDVIPAGTAVVLAGEAGDYTLAYTTSSDAAPEDNLLKGSDAAETTTGGDLYYMLSKSSDGSKVGFYWGADEGAAFTNGAHKAYLALTAAQAKAFKGFSFDEAVTNAINGINAENNAKADIYNLAGQKVNGTLKAGIYIQNGKKMVVK